MTSISMFLVRVITKRGGACRFTMRRGEVPGSSVQLGVQKLSSQDQTSTPCDPPDSPGIGMDPKRGSNWLLASKWFRFGRKLGRDGKP